MAKPPRAVDVPMKVVGFVRPTVIARAVSALWGPPLPALVLFKASYGSKTYYSIQKKYV